MARKGDEAEAEFKAIFLEHYETVLRVLLRLTGNRAQAEELANEVFWRASRKSLSWLVTNNVGGWLYRTATRAGIDALRAADRRKRYEQAASRESETDGQKDGALKELVREEERRKVRRALSSMKAARAQMLLMRADGVSYQEIAEALEVSPGSVGTLLKRAEEEFRKRYLREEKR
jgi:RNA polymerase sigma-70 factor (ECF subfamily)